VISSSKWTRNGLSGESREPLTKQVRYSSGHSAN